jgi:cell shape-determining protein MreC
LDDQAVALLEEKNRQTEQMKERIASLSSDNERLKRLLESRPGAPPSP